MNKQKIRWAVIEIRPDGLISTCSTHDDKKIAKSFLKEAEEERDERAKYFYDPLMAECKYELKEIKNETLV